MTGLRIFIADDHELVRRGLRTLLKGHENWQVVGEAADGKEAVEQVTLLKPDIVILDVSMPRLNGLEATRRISKLFHRLPVLILTMHESDELIREVLAAGARGYVTKSGAMEEVIRAVEALWKRKTYFTSNAEEVMLHSFLSGPAEPGEAEISRGRLTSRQQEILQLLAEGKTSKEVALELHLSIKTVETHRTNIMNRLNCHSVIDLVRYAIRNNIIEA
ncbi:MAG: response regulator transcription factor [Candidatus Acidiferrales bacterium]